MADGAKLKLVKGNESRSTLEPLRGQYIRPVRVERPVTPRKALTAASKLFRDARLGHIPTDEASRLAYILKTTSDLVERAEVEPRIAALEARIASLTDILARQR